MRLSALPFSAIFPALCLVLVIGIASPGATLIAEDRIARPGETVATTMHFSSTGLACSGVQFDIEYDPAVSIHVVPGAVISRASKLLFQGTPRKGVLRVLVVGFNRDTLADGELIRLFVTVAPNAPSFVSQLKIANPAATTPESASESLETSPISITIQSGAPTQLAPLPGVLNAASLLPGPISPGEIVTLFTSTTSLTPVLTLNGQGATVLYAGNNQINAIVPWDLEPEGMANLEIVQGQTRARVPIPVSPVSPAIFTLDAGGIGQGAILNQDYSQNSESSPATRGSVVMVFGTGFGVMNPPPAGGLEGVSQTVNNVTASIGGIPAEVTYAGSAPGLILGLTQINLRIPESMEANPRAPLTLTVRQQSTQAGVTVSIR